MRILTYAEIFGRGLVRKYFPRRSMWELDYDPYDKEACAQIANRRLEIVGSYPGEGALQICQCLLSIVGQSYPTGPLADQYFRNLQIVLRTKPRLETPGQLVIGLGPGRCGSTSLAAMLGAATNSCCTHETPPVIFWKPEIEQVEFHVKRFRMLSDYYSLVGDVSHWWLNSIEQVFSQFPEAKVIGLIRDPDECAISFMRIQGFGKGSFNPWATRGNGLWRTGHWDPTYPSYSLPGYAKRSPDRAKREFITKYVKEYNATLEQMARNAPYRVSLVRTEDLNKAEIQERIGKLVGAEGQVRSLRLNVKRTDDGKHSQIKI